MRFVVHQLGKALHCSAAMNCQRSGGIVATMEHQAVQQLLDRKHFALFKVNGRTFDTHSFLGDLHPVQHIALLAHDERRHDLGGGSDQAAAVGIFLIDHPTGSSIHQNRFLR